MSSVLCACVYVRIYVRIITKSSSDSSHLGNYRGDIQVLCPASLRPRTCAMICSALSDSEYSEHGRLSLARRLTSYRLSELDLSTTKELEHFPLRRGVSTLDLEVNEGR